MADTPLDADNDVAYDEGSVFRRVLGRMNSRASLFSRRSTMDDDTISNAPSERPAIPTMIQPAESQSTPLPILSMIVLSIVRYANLYLDDAYLSSDDARRIPFCQCVHTVPLVHGERYVPFDGLSHGCSSSP